VRALVRRCGVEGRKRIREEVLFGSGGRSTVCCEAEFSDGKKGGNRADDHEPGVSHNGMFSWCAK
jgi:hypothetical protein